MDKDNERRWFPSSKGVFSVRSFYDVVHDSQECDVDWKWYWKKLVLPKILVFFWLAILEKILTMDKLKRGSIVLVNGCPMCLFDEETSFYLLIDCSYATRAWGDCF